MGQVDYKSAVFWYIISIMFMPFNFILEELFVIASNIVTFLNKYSSKQ